MRMFLTFLFLLSGIINASAVTIQRSDSASLFIKANENYEQGNYEEAEKLYLKIISSGFINGKIYYNLGNTYFRLGNTGRAIQYYRSAEMLIPRNEDLEANLRYARGDRKDKLTSQSFTKLLKELFFWYDKTTIKEMTYAFLIFNSLFWILFGMRFFRRSRYIKIAIFIVLIISLTALATVAVRIILLRAYPPAVIISSEISVRSGMDPKSTTLFELHEGAEVIIEKTRNKWCLISLPSGKKGWIEKKNLGMITQ